MEYRQLGRTGLKVTQLGYGAMEIRGPKVWGGRPVSDEQAERVLNAVLDAGINFIDTSPDYGLSEPRIGRYISSRRKEYLRYTLSHPHCHTTIVGTLNLEHLRTNIAAARKGPLPTDVTREIRSRVEAAGAR